MSLFRLAALPLLALALVAPADAATTKLTPPTGVHGFLAEKTDDDASFSRTPSFAWNPVRGAAKYELALSTSPLFSSSGLVWNDASLTSPVAAVPISLPWITGTPHSLYARVRAISAGGSVGPWSGSYGFDMRWADDGVPSPLPAADGLIRWTPVDGATAYQVWFLNTNIMGSGKSKIFQTTTNVADEREYYAFHPTAAFISEVYWRVRAVRRTDFTASNKLPTVSYGPWSPIYQSTNSPFKTGVFDGFDTMAEPAVEGHDPAKDGYSLTPGFVFNGNAGFGSPAELYRVYIFSDADCVNTVYRGAVVGSPAWAPRSSGPLKLPADDKELALARLYNVGDGDETSTSADGASVKPTEGTAASTFTVTYLNQSTPASGSGGSGGTSGSGGSSGSSGGSSSGSGSPGGASSSTGVVFPSSLTGVGSPIDLWDINWPNGRYYWAVVPVYWAYVVNPASPPTGGSSSLPIVYFDAEVPQDECTALRSSSFGKASARPEVMDAASHVPYLWGLAPSGGLRAATKHTPKVYGTPLVTWKTALAASAYEVQWSKSAYPWRPRGNLFTFATATTLQLKPGRWYYRVRGIDLSLPTGAAQMAWSNKVGVDIAKPKFKLVPGK
jgi:hypothetical protein